MKKRFLSIRQLMTVLVAYALTGLMVTSCVDQNTDLSRPDNGNQTNQGFDCSTSQECQLNVQYDVPGELPVLFNVYMENPYEKEAVEDADGKIVNRIVKKKGLEPIITRVTDKNGKYSGKETIPAYLGVDEIYICTDYVGVPAAYKTTLVGNTIQADINWDNWYDPAPALQTRAGGDFTYPTYLGKLSDWNEKGRPEILDNEGALSLGDAFLAVINKTLPEAGTCPEKYRQSADFRVYDEENRKVEVKVRFIGGTSAASSTFGYYCYKNGDSKEKIQKAKKTIIFANTRTGVGIKGGECVQLHYIDEDGVDRGTEFPNNTMIGWFIINDSFKSGNIDNGYGTMYSTKSLNNDKRTHTAAFKINDFVVLSFEDWNDYDYNDVMFNVLANPKEAIETPDFPEVDPGEDLEDDKMVAYRLNYKGILAFEDNWPSMGDYDLNDVVVKYKSVMSFNTKNEVITTEDTFTALWSGAIYSNSFSYQLNTGRDNVKCFEIDAEGKQQAREMDKDLSSATIPVFIDVKVATGENAKTTTISFKNEFVNPVGHESFGTAPYNPFISVFKGLNYNRVEVHLVNHKPTEKADMSKFGTLKDMSEPGKDIYYVSKDKYPFAIHLADAEEFSTIEKEAIDVTYPKFASWTESNGAKDKDWYFPKK